MSHIMKIGASDDVWMKAQRALHDAQTQGRVPVRWFLGRETWRRFKAAAGPMVRSHAPVDQLLGVPFTVRNQGPPDLLELDVF